MPILKKTVASHQCSPSFMDGKNRLNPRNWDFSDNQPSESMLKPTLGVSFPGSNSPLFQPGFLRFGANSDQTTVIDDRHSKESSINFTWVPERSFLHPPKTINHLQTMHATSEMIDVQSSTITSNSSTPDFPIDAKPINARKEPSSKNKEAKKRPSSRSKKNGGSVSASTGKREKKNQDENFNGVMMDLSGVPPPICSCTGMPRQCYRWGAGGWQSSCCTTGLSEYPLPVSPARPGSRMAGRKMSISAYTKLLHRLATEGHDLSYAVDLKNHWARHGTNKFVTIK